MVFLLGLCQDSVRENWEHFPNTWSEDTQAELPTKLNRYDYIKYTIYKHTNKYNVHKFLSPINCNMISVNTNDMIIMYTN